MLARSSVLFTTLALLLITISSSNANPATSPLQRRSMIESRDSPAPVGALAAPLAVKDSPPSQQSRFAPQEKIKPLEAKPVVAAEAIVASNSGETTTTTEQGVFNASEVARSNNSPSKGSYASGGYRKAAKFNPFPTLNDPLRRTGGVMASIS